MIRTSPINLSIPNLSQLMPFRIKRFAEKDFNDPTDYTPEQQEVKKLSRATILKR
jgi:hypothetical protein